jgi:hypothetical protein
MVAFRPTVLCWASRGNTQLADDVEQLFEHAIGVLADAMTLDRKLFDTSRAAATSCAANASHRPRGLAG